MSKSGLVIICIFAVIGIVTCVFTLFRIVDWLYDKSDKFQLLCSQYERMSDTLEDIHKIVELQQDEIKLLKERIDIYEESNSED